MQTDAVPLAGPLRAENAMIEKRIAAPARSAFAATGRLIVAALILNVLLACNDTENAHSGNARARPAPVSGASSKTLEPRASVTQQNAVEAGDTRLLEAVFSQLFRFRDRSLQGERASLFFVGIGDFNANLVDPHPGLTKALGQEGVRVLPQSASSFDVQRGVRHRDTGELGLLFYTEPGCVTGEEAFARGGYVEHGKSGMRFLLLLRRTEGVWRVVEVGPTGVS